MCKGSYVQGMQRSICARVHMCKGCKGPYVQGFIGMCKGCKGPYVQGSICARGARAQMCKGSYVQGVQGSTYARGARVHIVALCAIVYIGIYSDSFASVTLIKLRA